ncbi:hypothetical protein L202_03936 [Cryptococcus amylolentus CBS 6039]|uniref:ATP-dependent DNA ligase family profile domain-containing protein n=2 Tax=Cryptococcus amylolentus TaxID=104669 RepID=A0A1E3HPK3_9TREE|nr:hypothetical protein L202_03936 [Cryptococcus amylolentus CBS 6039]ODN78289.1 hypothetical protein L202_03936 [Cryptococcus amylolentus CBS 6039]ODO07111.1 hypothetical protein I350_04480 [Cryptococcus amylolentus CBS 6273]
MLRARLIRQLAPLAQHARATIRPCSALPSRALTVPLSRGRFTKPYSTSPAQPTVEQQLQRLVSLLKEVSAVNSKAEKQRIISQYPDLRKVLELIYEPNLRTHMTSTQFHKILSTPEPTLSPSPLDNLPSDIPTLFHLLSSRAVTGNAAKTLILSFLEAHGVRRKEELEDMFGRLLDRNLNGGFGARILKEVQWLGEEGTKAEGGVKGEGGAKRGRPRKFPPPEPLDSAAVPTTTKARQSPKSSPTTPNATPVLPNFGPLEKFEVALGKSIEPPFDALFSGRTGGGVWYASRKLDGVRVLTFLDFLVPPSADGEEGGGKPELISTHFVSRSGRAFKSLSKLGEQLSTLAEYPKLGEILSYDTETIPLSPYSSSGTGIVKRLVLDGEVCVMRPKTPSELKISEAKDDGSPASGIWQANDPYVEDFPSTVSQVRKSGTIQHLSYFLFDFLPWGEVHAKGALPGYGLSQTFSQRAQALQELTSWFDKELEAQGVGKEGRMVKELRQCKVEGLGDVEGMVERAAEEGWEGLILRKDALYKGKRSPDVRKFKEWQDAEYPVLSLTTTTMRLSINGTFAERQAMANVWIEHKGTKVAVGSGWTAEERVRYAERPEEIVGKEITVEFFEESERLGADGEKEGGKSLRFPRVKKVWEEGKRDI